VTVITGFPCYPKGHIYEGWKQKLISEEYSDGVHIVRLPQLPDHSKSAFRRILYYASFMTSAMTLGNFRFDKADAVIVYESAVITGIAATTLARLHRVPVIYYTVDLWPESVTSTGMLKNRLALRVLKWLCGATYRSADRMVGITKGYLRRFAEMGVKPERMDLVYYWSPAAKGKAPADFDPESVLPSDGKFRIVYAGNMGPAQNLFNVLDAAALLRDLPDVEFVLIGDGLDFAALQKKKTALHLDNVRFTGRLPAEVMPAIQSRADALLVHIKSDELTRVSIPSKTQAYMQTGRPVLMAADGESADFVNEHGFGLAVSPSDPKALADAIRKLRDMPIAEREAMGQRGIDAYEKCCSARVCGSRLCEIIEQAVEAREKKR
jgi:glycosyltransferase involved in cell wall biosynthesis